HRLLADPRVDEVEVLLPGLVVVSDLPGAVDSLAVAGEGAGETLRELERREVGLRPRRLPDAAGQAHLVDACDAPLVEVVLEEGAATLIPADRGQPVRRLGNRHRPPFDHERLVAQPLERDPGTDIGRLGRALLAR